MQISAGAIIYTYEDNDIQYLLIRDFHGNYGFAKGHLEANETEIEAASREIKEEVGLSVEIDDSFRKELNYIMPDGIAKKVIYFLARYTSQIPVSQPEEVEEILLLPFAEAFDILTFDNMKEVFVQADSYIRNKTE